MIINHNLMANNALRNMNINSTNASKAMSKLSSGLRINSAADDAAGLAISEKMRAQINGLDQASSNAQDGISMIQTAEGALNETTSILQRMRELAVQASNDTNTTSDRGEIQKEINQLTSEVNRISGTTEFNKQILMDGSKSASSVTGASVSITKAGVNAIQEVYTYQFTTDVACGECDIVLHGNTIITQANLAACIDCTSIAGSIAQLATIINRDCSANLVATASGDKLTLTAVAGGGYDGACTATLLCIGGCTGTHMTTSKVDGKDCAAQIQKLTFSDETVQEGLKLTIGNKTIALWNSNSGTYANSTEAKLALGADDLLDIYCSTGAIATTICAVDLVTDIIADAATFSGVGLAYCTTTSTDKNDILMVTTNDTGAIAANQTVASLTASDGTASGMDNGMMLQIGANADQTFRITFSDMSSKAIKIAGQASGQQLITSTNKTASFTTVANVTNNGDASVEYAFDVSDAKKATAAIDGIDDAIQAVSAERSKLGAYQNRLEHTINNLGTSSENLTSAESRIRDVDMAAEMSKYSKDNILSQAAQAMLAQANQQPQQVLQLLR